MKKVRFQFSDLAVMVITIPILVIMYVINFLECLWIKIRGER